MNTDTRNTQELNREKENKTMIINIDNTIRRIEIMGNGYSYRYFHYVDGTSLEAIRAAIDTYAPKAWQGKPFKVHEFGKRKNEAVTYRGVQDSKTEIDVIQEDGTVRTMYVFGKYAGSYDKEELEQYKAEITREAEAQAQRRSLYKAVDEAMKLMDVTQLEALAKLVTEATQR